MAVTQLKLKFGKMLSDCLRNGDIKQKDLASVLGITSSAVSQIMHGKIVPNQEQLNQIYELLALDRAKAYEMDSMLSKIRTGSKSLRSPLNELIFRLRCERNLSIRQLANLSGVPMARLNAYENCFEANASRDDADRLAPILECSSTAILYPAGFGDEVHESSGTYRTERQIPLLDLSDLDHYDGKTSITQFGKPRATKVIDSEQFNYMDFIALNASAKSLSIGIPGDVMLFLADRPLEGYRELNLCRDSDGRYSLIEYRRGKRKVFKIAGARRLAENSIPEWEIPVIEISIKMTKI